jgi:hypothetical protein
MGKVATSVTDELNNVGTFPKKNISDIPVYSLDGPATSLV